jgi:hypothetical protein
MEVRAAVDFLRDVREVGAGGVGVIAADLGGWAAALSAGLSSRIESLVLLSPPCADGIWQEPHRRPPATATTRSWCYRGRTTRCGRCRPRAERGRGLRTVQSMPATV